MGKNWNAIITQKSIEIYSIECQNQNQLFLERDQLVYIKKRNISKEHNHQIKKAFSKTV